MLQFNYCNLKFKGYNIIEKMIYKIGNNFDFAVFDEIHNLNKSDDGDIYENLIKILDCNFLALSATIGNIGPGAGEGSRLAVGSTIFGGMLISTFFTLYVTPTMYVLLTKNTKRIDAVDIELKKQLR